MIKKILSLFSFITFVVNILIIEWPRDVIIRYMQKIQPEIFYQNAYVIYDEIAVWIFILFCLVEHIAFYAFALFNDYDKKNMIKKSIVHIIISLPISVLFYLIISVVLDDIRGL